MKEFGLTIESLIHEKIMLYRDLLDILEMEKKSIKEIDLEGLWEIAEQKQKTSAIIESIRKKIIETLKDASPSIDMDEGRLEISQVLTLVPSEISGRIQKAHMTLISLKGDIQALLSENRRFVGEYLTVLDELIGIITDSGNPDAVYGRDRCAAKINTNLLMHREV